MSDKLNVYLYSILLVSCCFFVSCSPYATGDILDRVDAIINTKPDSALLLLESIESPESLSEKEYARYGLLLVKAHKFNKISISDDAFITYIIDYYEKHPEDDLGRAYFYAGQVFEEQGNIEEAESYYLKSFLFEGENTLKLKAYSAYFLADLFENHKKDYKKAISYYEQALTYFKKNNLAFREERILKLIGDCYVKDQQLPKAIEKYKMAIANVPKDSTTLLSGIYNDIAKVLVSLEKYPEAILAIDLGIEAAVLSKDLAISYVIKGDVFEKLGMRDSALFYNNKAIHYAKDTEDYDMLHSAYNSIYTIALETNNWELALDNYRNFNEVTEIMGRKQKYDDIKYLERKIDFEKNRSLYFQNRLKVLTIIFLIFLIGCVIPLAFAYYRNKKKKYIEAINQRLEAKQEVIRSVMKGRSQNVELYRKMVVLSISPQKNKYSAFLHNANKILYGEDSPFEFDWEYTLSLINETYDNYAKRLYENYPDFTVLEIKICVLLKIGFSLTEIADITGKSMHTIYKYSSNIRKKAGIPENANTVEFLDNQLM